MLHMLTQENLEKVVWDRFFADNPHLKRGQTMTSPVATVRDGVIISDFERESAAGVKVATAKSFKVKHDADGRLDNMEIGSARGWVYPYTVVHLDATAWLSKRVGDIVKVTNPTTFEIMEISLTPGMQESARRVLVRFALEDGEAPNSHPSFE